MRNIILNRLCAVVLILGLYLPNVQAQQFGVSGGSAPDQNQSQEHQDLDAYRALLLELLDSMQGHSESFGEQTLRSQQWQRLQEQLLLLPEEDLAIMLQRAPAAHDLRLRYEHLRRFSGANKAEPFAPVSPGGVRTIEFPDPETSIAACASISASEGLGLLIEVFTIKEILTAATWECLETVLGENDASACTLANIINETAEAEYRAAEACLTEQRDSYLDAILETEENIADHLSDFVDATTSSRASQSSLDDAQDDLNTAVDDLDTLQSTLESDLISIESDLDESLDDLTALASDLNSLAAMAADIQFRAQVNQVDIEDADERAADVQESTVEIRDDTQQAISDLTTFQSQLDTLNTVNDDGLAQQQRSALVAALADSTLQIIRFQLPASTGGALEESREVVSQTIQAFALIGNDISTAQSLFDQGDQAFNSQDYLGAYRFYAQAYQSLTSSGRFKDQIFGDQ
ncbi:MAG: hypothetical protein MI750_07950 [Xanthomonadales bacterium]|nr:hypothetical protein [Xanthomonadales bacterium]